MKICPNPKCGKTIENDKAKFCRYCGSELPVIPESHVSDEEVHDEVVHDLDDGIVLSPTPAGGDSPRITPVADLRPRADGISLGLADSSQMPGITLTDNDYSSTGNQTTIPKKPNSNLVWAILTTVLCSPLFGIIAIVHASKVNAKYASGDYQGAEQASSRAAAWSTVAAIVGLIGWVIIAGGGL